MSTAAIGECVNGYIKKAVKACIESEKHSRILVCDDMMCYVEYTKTAAHMGGLNYNELENRFVTCQSLGAVFLCKFTYKT